MVESILKSLESQKKKKKDGQERLPDRHCVVALMKKFRQTEICGIDLIVADPARMIS